MKLERAVGKSSWKEQLERAVGKSSWKEQLEKRKIGKFEVGMYKSKLKSFKCSINPYCIGKFWKTHPDFFFRNFDFRGDFWKTHPSIFCEYLSIFCKISGHDLDWFLENSSILGCVFQNSVCFTPRNSLNIFFRPNALFWISFPEIGPASAPEICQ